MNLVDLPTFPFHWRYDVMGHVYADLFDAPVMRVMPVAFQHYVQCWWSEEHERFLIDGYPKGEEPSSGEIWGFG